MAHDRYRLNGYRPQNTVSGHEQWRCKLSGRSFICVRTHAICQSPRPIALVGTYNDDETPNLAPMSWYNIVSHDPPLVMISFGGQRERIKDGERNILQRKVFTISSAYVKAADKNSRDWLFQSSEDYAEALNFAAINAPPGISEFALCGLTPVPGKQVLAPLVEVNNIKCIEEALLEIDLLRRKRLFQWNYH